MDTLEKKDLNDPEQLLSHESKTEKCDSDWRQVSCLITFFNSSCQSLKGKEATENNIHELIRKQKS